LTYLSRFRAEVKRPRLLAIGSNCRFDRGVVIRNPHRVSIGSNVWLKEGVILDGRTSGNIGIRIGSNVTIRAYTYIDTYWGHIVIGSGTQIAQHVYLGGNGELVIGKNVMISANTCITSVAHGCNPTDDTPYVDQPERRRPVKIGDNVWIAANATVIDGVTVASGAVIGAGTVVTKNVPPEILVGGNPARPIRSLRSVGSRAKVVSDLTLSSPLDPTSGCCPKECP
jgi:acetyltransferase-like isoleucine patch superfamily enzyme